MFFFIKERISALTDFYVREQSLFLRSIKKNPFKPNRFLIQKIFKWVINPVIFTYICQILGVSKLLYVT